MPPYRNVGRLQEISIRSLSMQLARSIASLATGTYTRVKQTSSVKKGAKALKSKTSRPHQITVVVPTKEIQRIKKFIAQNTPKSLRNELFEKVLKLVTEIILTNVKLSDKRAKLSAPSFSERVSQLDEGVMYVFNVLMYKEITELNFTIVLHLAMKWVDSCRLSNMDPKEVNLDYTRIETIFLKHFAENAKTMVNLVSLTWPHLISGDLVRIIGHHLQSLRELILACSCETGPFIEEERKGTGKVGSQEDLISSLRSLFKRCPGDFTAKSPCGCPKLKRLILPNLDDEDGKAAAIIAEALVVLTNLEAVTGISTLASVTKLKDKAFPSSLTLRALNDYDPFKQRTMPEVEFLKQLLPKLESIELRVSEDLTKRILKQFHGIKELSIECPNFHTMAKNYSSLVYLNISLDFQCPWPLFLILSKFCKNLKYLTLEHSTFKIDPQNLEQMKYPKMQNLIFLKLIRSSFIEFVALHAFVKGCSQLAEIYITLSNDRNYSVDEFNDQLISAIAPHLKHLERFTAECLYKFNLYLHLNCTLTIASADILIRNCPKLKFIGHLDSWDVKDNDIKDISLEIQNNNWDLEVA